MPSRIFFGSPAQESGLGDDTGEIARWWNHPPQPYPYARPREPWLLPPQQREWTTSPEVEGISSEPLGDAWIPFPNQPYLQVIRHPEFLPPMPVREWTTSPEVEGVPSESFAWWQPQPNVPYLRIIRHPELLPPSVPLTFEPSIHSTFTEQELGPGRTLAEVLLPSGAKPTGQSTAIYVVAWETHRYLNKIGNWTAAIPAYHELADDIERGWNLSLVQENTHPLNRADLEHMLYRGIVEDKRYEVDESGQALLELAGSFSGLALAQRATPTKASYTAKLGAAVGSIDGGIMPAITGSIVTPPDGATRDIDIDFNEDGNSPISRYSRLLKIGEYARWALRENWEKDTLEFVAMTTPPDSGYVLVGAEAATTEMQQASAAGLALIGDRPEIRREGNGVINRVIAFGSDTVVVAGETTNPPLTLQPATLTDPYTVQVGTNPDGSNYFYLEDSTSVTRHGAIEVVLQRTDVKNPSDDAGTRQLAANVLYQIAALELQRHRAPKLFVTVPIANGPQIWALPGDMMRLQYTGEVDAGSGVVTWQEFDKWFLVIERHDKSDESGMRDVTFVLAAPDLPDVTVPVIDPITQEELVDPETGVPLEEPAFPGNDFIDVPPLFTLEDPLLPAGLEGLMPGLGGGGWPLGPDCCDDPSVGIHDLDAPADPVNPPPAWQTVTVVAGNSLSSSAGPALTPSSVHVLLGYTEGTSGDFGTLTPTDATVTELASYILQELTSQYGNYKIWLIKANGPSPSWTLTGTAVQGKLVVGEAAAPFASVSALTGTDIDQLNQAGPYDATIVCETSITMEDSNDMAVGFFSRYVHPAATASEIQHEWDSVAQGSVAPPFHRGKLGSAATTDPVNALSRQRVASGSASMQFNYVLAAAIRLRTSN